MENLWKNLTVDNVALVIAVVATILFSALAAQAELRLWKKVHKGESRRRQQQFITEGKSHLR
jgi:uncharacterized membrane protein